MLVRCEGCRGRRSDLFLESVVREVGHELNRATEPSEHWARVCKEGILHGVHGVRASTHRPRPKQRQGSPLAHRAQRPTTLCPSSLLCPLPSPLNSAGIVGGYDLTLCHTSCIRSHRPAPTISYLSSSPGQIPDSPTHATYLPSILSSSFAPEHSRTCREQQTRRSHLHFELKPSLTFASFRTHDRLRPFTSSLSCRQSRQEPNSNTRALDMFVQFIMPHAPQD